jgi:hypothetical protein
MLKRYKVRYGASMLILDLPKDTTIGDIKANENFRASLGYGDNVNALYGGATLPNSALAPEFHEQPGMSTFAGAIVIETACNKKEGK